MRDVRYGMCGARGLCVLGGCVEGGGGGVSRGLQHGGGDRCILTGGTARLHLVMVVRRVALCWKVTTKGGKGNAALRHPKVWVSTAIYVVLYPSLTTPKSLLGGCGCNLPKFLMIFYQALSNYITQEVIVKTDTFSVVCHLQTCNKTFFHF